MKNPIVVCLLLGLWLCVCNVAIAQSDPWFTGASHFAQNGCFSSNSTPKVRQVNGAGGIQRPYLATFTGGRTVGGFSSCMAMTSYATSHKTASGSVIPGLGNKITVNFHEPIEFRGIGIDGKWPQRVTVTVDGASMDVDLGNYQGSGTGYSIVGDPRPGALAGKRFSTITVSSDDPEWRFGIYSIHYSNLPNGGEFSEPDLCPSATSTRPQPEYIDRFGWRMHSAVSDTEGLVLSDVRLNGRLLAERISVPYYRIETSTSPPVRGELRPDDAGGILRSRLVKYDPIWNDERLLVRAWYAIEGIPSSTGCLSVKQEYEFTRAGLDAPCEPGDNITCQKYRALVSYKYSGSTTSPFSVSVAQRNHFTVNGASRNSVGIFRDCDLPLFDCSPNNEFVFAKRINPLFTEFYSSVVADGRDIHSWDNVHQTWQSRVVEPAEETSHFP